MAFKNYRGITVRPQNKNLRRGGKPGHDGSNAGRRTKAFKNEAVEAFWKSDPIKLLSKIIKGENIPQKINSEGEIIDVPASPSDRIESAKILKEWAFGKEVTTTINLEFVYGFVQKITNIINKVLVDKCPHCGTQLPYREATIKELEVIAEEQTKAA